MAFAIGISVEEFKHLSPAKLECCLNGYKMKRKLIDEAMWIWFGSYGISAVNVAVEHCLAGRKAKSKYIKKPVIEELEEKNKPMTEEELQRQRELFVAQLEVMKTNFELNHKK